MGEVEGDVEVVVELVLELGDAWVWESDLKEGVTGGGGGGRKVSYALGKETFGEAMEEEIVVDGGGRGEGGTGGGEEDQEREEEKVKESLGTHLRFFGFRERWFWF